MWRPRLRPQFVTVLIVAAAAAISACGADNDVGPSEAVDKVTVSPPEASVEAGKGVSLTPSLVNAAGAALPGVGLQWSTSDAAVATVSQSGVVSGVRSGVARITAAAGNRSGSALVSVSTSTGPTPPSNGTVSTPGGEVKVVAPAASLPTGAQISIEPVPTPATPGTTVPGTVFKIGVFGIPTRPPLRITVRYSTAGLPPGFDETKLTLSRKVGVFWVPLPSVVDTAQKTITAEIPAQFVTMADVIASRSERAADEDLIVGATLFVTEVEVASVQVDVGGTRRISMRVRSLATGGLVPVTASPATSSDPNVVSVGAPTASGTEVAADILGRSSGTAVVRLAGAVTVPGGQETFGGEVTVSVLPQTVLSVNISGLPQEVAGDVTVSGPGGFVRRVTSTQDLVVAPGTYTVSAGAITVPNQVYSPVQQTQTITVSARETAIARVAYVPTRGSLAVVASGLPAGVNAAITVSGPNGFSRNLTASETIPGLVAGSYVVTAATVTAGAQVYSATPATRTVAVGAGQTASASVSYTAAAASLTVTIAGLPNGIAARVAVTGPNAYSRELTASDTLRGLAPGEYKVVASNISLLPDVYEPSTPEQVLTVTGGAASSASVNYARARGSLTVGATGAGAICWARITISGPEGTVSTDVYFNSTPRIFDQLLPGRYQIIGERVNGLSAPNDPDVVCGPIGPSQEVTVVARANTTVTVAYSRFFRILVLGAGNGTGTVSGSGISCTIAAGIATGTCSVYLFQTATLTIAAGAESRITEIEHTYAKVRGAPCTVAPGSSLTEKSCTLTMNEHNVVTATINLWP